MGEANRLGVRLGGLEFGGPFGHKTFGLSVCLSNRPAKKLSYNENGLLAHSMKPIKSCWRIKVRAHEDSQPSRTLLQRALVCLGEHRVEGFRIGPCPVSAHCRGLLSAPWSP